MSHCRRKCLFLIITVISLSFLIGCFLKGEKKPPYFNPPAKIIDDYTGLMEGEEVNWVWLRLGVRLRSYPNITLKPFENLASIDDQGITNRIYKGLQAWFKENDIILLDDGELVCIGALIDLNPNRPFYYEYNPFYEKEDDLFIELELVMREKNTQETICKIRHGVTGTDINIITDQIRADLIRYFEAHK